MTFSRLRRGMTLIELMVVVAIVTLMSALAVSFLESMYQQSRVNTTTRMIQGMLSAARQRAVTMNVPVGLYIGKATGTSMATSTAGAFLFYDNLQGTTVGYFGADDILTTCPVNPNIGTGEAATSPCGVIQGPARMLPMDADGNEVVVLGSPLSSQGLPVAITNESTTNGFTVMYSAYGLATVYSSTGTNNQQALPETINLLQDNSLLTTRSILVNSSGTAVVQ